MLTRLPVFTLPIFYTVMFALPVISLHAWPAVYHIVLSQLVKLPSVDLTRFYRTLWASYFMQHLAVPFSKG